MPSRDAVAGCLCDGATLVVHDVPCEELRRRGRLRYKKRQMYGSAIVSGEPIERLISTLTEFHDAGMKFDTMAAMAGVSVSAPHGLVMGTRKKLYPGTYRRLLRVEFQPDDWAMVSSVAAERKLQALMAHGVPLRLVAEYGSSTAYLNEVQRGTPYVALTQRIAVLIDRAYEDLAYAPPTSPHASRLISHARRIGYAPPECWTEETIRDPDAKPDLSRSGVTSRGMSLDTPYGPADVVVVEKILGGEPVPASRADCFAVFERITYQQYDDVAHALGVTRKSVATRHDRHRGAYRKAAA